MPTGPRDDWYHPTPFEVATGWLTGYEDEAALAVDPAWPVDETPLEALRQLLLPVLRSAPAMIGFSGGRDSSALLAVATAVANEEGLAPPLPVTRRYPHVPSTYEDEWQELVVRHLGLTEWMRLPFGDEPDLLGAPASASLRAHGLLWPAPVHLDAVFMPLLPGSTLVTGDGGDEVFGRHRVAPITRLLRGQRPGAHPVRQIVGALAPRPARRRLIARQTGVGPDWLRPRERYRFAQARIDDAAAAPLPWRDAVQWLLRRRSWTMGTHNMRLMAANYGKTYMHPFLESRFIKALGHAEGWHGYTSRTHAMRQLFGHLLPRDAIERNTKAYFGSAYVGKASQTFIAEAWQADYLDSTLVDPHKVQKALRRQPPHGQAVLLLQTAYLSSQ